MGKQLGKIFALLFLAVLPASADSILLSSGLGIGSGCSTSCGNIDIGSGGGYEISDRQRLAQAFVLDTAAHVSTLNVAISAYYRNPTQVDVLLTNSLGNTATILDGNLFYLSYPSTPQVLTMTTNLELGPGTYYVLLTSLAGPESDPEGAFVQNAGSIGSGYYANYGLGINPTNATWQTFNSPTIGFELVGTEVSAVPEPSMLLLLGSGLGLLALGKLPRSCETPV